tara:strand:- start:184 stop:945 length:762 start_codon:yes stop_codon:yes gene_type:complete
MKLISYIRVSSDSQTDNQSPTVQQEINERTLMLLQEKEELPTNLPLHIVSDLGVSGLLEFKDREKGQHLETLEEGDVIFVSGVDRLARDNRILEDFLFNCKNKGVSVHVSNTGNVTMGVNAQKKLQVSVEAVFSTYFASQVKKNVRRGKDSKRGLYHEDSDSKGYIGGRPNWGYAIIGESKNSQIVKEKWRDEVFEFMSSLHNGNVSSRRIQSECLERFGKEKTPGYVTITKLFMTDEAKKSYEENLTIRQEV